MDIRKAEEFKVKQQELIAKKEQEELSSISIIKSIERTEELRNKVYENSMIGSQGFSVLFSSAAMFLFFYSYTKGFSTSFPRAAVFFSKSVAVRALIPVFMLRTGVYLDQVHFESQTNPIAFDDYIQSYNYTQNLIQRRLAKMSWPERIKFSLNLDLQYFINTISSLINKD